MRRHLTLFYPVRQVGGAQFLFARVARELAEKHAWSVSVIDYEDGFIRLKLAEWGVPFEFTSCQNAGAKISIGDTTLLLSLSELPEALARLSGGNKSRILLWSLHPYNALAFFRHGYLYTRLKPSVRSLAPRLLEPLHWRRMRTLFADFSTHEALAYMDGANARYPVTLGLHVRSREYLPIPVAAKRARAPVMVERGALSVGWLGRVAEDKVHTIVATLELCSRHASRHGLQFDYHIVGDGPALARMRGMAYPGVRLCFAGQLLGDALDGYLSEYFEVGFAMGTSILEIALLGIPVVVSDYSNRPIRSEALALRWASQIEDYTLGEIVGERHLAARISLDDVARVCRDPDENHAVGEACRAYAEQHHSIGRVGARLSSLLEQTQFTLERARLLAGSRLRPLGPAMARMVNRVRP